MLKRYLRSIATILISSATMTVAFAQELPVVDSDQQFVDFLDNTLKNEAVNPETRRAFTRRSWTYWSDRKMDYNIHPEKYEAALSLFHQNQQKFKSDRQIKIDRYEKAIESFRRFDSRNALAKDPILFVGSSSIVFWETAKSFPGLPVINRGFGGASLPEIIHYYDDVIKKHAPSVLILYSDIDVEGGKSPEVAVHAFEELIERVKTDFPTTQILLLSMKPTLIDDFLGKDVRKNKIITNEKLLEWCNGEENLHFVDITNPMLNQGGTLRSDIFISDGMHLNALGYTLWDPVIRDSLAGLPKP